MKKTDRAIVGYLTLEELQALLDVPDLRTFSGIRDRAMLHLAFAAGLRVSELINLRLDQIGSQTPASVHILGKGRRERILPLWKETAVIIKAWLKIRPAGSAPDLFLNARAQADALRVRVHSLQACRRGRRDNPLARCHAYQSACSQAHLCDAYLTSPRDVRKVSLWLGHARTCAPNLPKNSRPSPPWRRQC